MRQISYWEAISERSVEGQASRTDARYLCNWNIGFWKTFPYFRDKNRRRRDFLKQKKRVLGKDDGHLWWKFQLNRTSSWYQNPCPDEKRFCKKKGVKGPEKKKSLEHVSAYFSSSSSGKNFNPIGLAVLKFWESQKRGGGTLKQQWTVAQGTYTVWISTSVNTDIQLESFFTI